MISTYLPFNHQDSNHFVVYLALSLFLAICHPMLAHKLCTVRRAKRIILCVWIFATFYCSPWLYLTKVERLYYIGIHEEVVTCKFALDRELYLGYFLTDITLFYIIPLLVSVVLYALIARILYQNDIFRRNGKGGPLEVGAKGSAAGGGGGSGSSKLTTSGQLMPPSSSSSTRMAYLQQKENSNSVSVNLNSNSSATCQLTKKNASSSSDASRVQVSFLLFCL